MSCVGRTREVVSSHLCGAGMISGTLGSSLGEIGRRFGCRSKERHLLPGGFGGSLEGKIRGIMVLEISCRCELDLSSGGCGWLDILECWSGIGSGRSYDVLPRGD